MTELSSNGAEVTGIKKCIDYIPYIRSIYLVCLCVCAKFTRIIANNCYGKRKGKGGKFICLQVLCPHRSLSPYNFAINPVVIRHKLRCSNLKLGNFHCILCVLRSVPEGASCMLVLNVGQIFLGCTVSQARRQ